MLYVDDEDIALAARRGIAVAHVPASNLKSGRPIAPAWRMQQAGIRLGLATDGPLSGNGMDLQGVLTLFPKLQKTRESRRDIVSARDALRAATLGGAEALGMADRIGSLEPGKGADVAFAETRDFNLQPVYDWYATLVYAMRPHNVRHVLVDGRWIVRDRRMTGFDQEEIMEAEDVLHRVSVNTNVNIELLKDLYQDPRLWDLIHAGKINDAILHVRSTSPRISLGGAKLVVEEFAREGRH
jgi:cytosine/adenosine deaminase-related metal-dependent hydrolase